MADKTISKVLSSRIEHTVLLPQTSKKMLDRLCREAKNYNFLGVCILPTFVERAKINLKDTNIKISTVVGFPLGVLSANVKSYEALAAISEGPDEIDMVMNISAFLDNDIDIVTKEIETIVKHAHHKKVLVKVIIETCLLSKKKIIQACHLAVDSGADFIKTSTGFSTSGVTIEDIQIIRHTVKDKIKIKASGGIKSVKFALSLIKAGADRIGTSASLKIMEEAEAIDKQRKREAIRLT